MKIINRSSSNVFWRAFDSGDGSNIFGIADGFIKPGKEVITPLSNSHVKIEIKPNGPLGLAHVSAGPVYDGDTTLMFTPNKRLVDFQGEISKYWNVGSGVNGFEASGSSYRVLYNMVSSTTAALNALGIAFTIAGKGIGTIGGAGAGLVSILLTGIGDSGAQVSLQKEEIETAVKDIIQEQDSQEFKSNIIWAWDWYQHNIQLAQSLTQSDQEYSEYDYKEFMAQLHSHLQGRTPFIGSMNAFSGNHEMRLTALPEFAMGINLHLQMERVKLIEKASLATVRENDYNYYIHIAEKYLSDIQESKFDLDKKGYEEIDKFDFWKTPELYTLKQGIFNYYCFGDDHLLEHTEHSLQGLISNLKMQRNKLKDTTAI